MCLIVVAHRTGERYALALAANRYEHHARPSAAADWWPELPDVVGGRDLVAGGSWLAVSRAGSLAAVTNFAEPPAAAAPRSRGLIVRDFVSTPGVARDALVRDAPHYGPFNALLLRQGRLDYVSNRGAAVHLAPGLHSLGNAALGADWPKLHRAERGMAAALTAADTRDVLFDLLGERAENAIGPEAHRHSLFIDGRTYGTRASTVVLVDYEGRVTFTERRFDSDGRPTGESHFEFGLEPSALGTTGLRESDA
jgi:uncharacterized protein with NRDE domain